MIMLPPSAWETVKFARRNVDGDVCRPGVLVIFPKKGAIMSATSTIEWTDATWNPLRGCTKVSPGCKHRYAETFAEKFRGVPGHAYEQGFDLRLVPEKLAEPLKWSVPKMVFVNSMSDLFHEDVGWALARVLHKPAHRAVRRAAQGAVGS